MRRLVLILALMLLAAACQAGDTAEPVAPLVAITPDEMADLIAASDRPVIVNVWASWCAPCRSEAPLLRTAALEWGDRVRFVGVDVRDTMDGATAFIAEFGLDVFEHRFDAPGAVPAALGGVGVPLTFFFDTAGTLVHTHRGVIDERTLALWLDDLVRQR